MKKITILLFLFTFHSLSAQNIGVNLSNPEYTLDVRSSNIAEAGQFNISNQNKSRYVRFFSGSDLYPDPSMTWSPGHNFLFATFNDATLDFTEYMRIGNSGNVGIGITDPQALLDVKGGDWNLDAGNPGDFRIGSSSFNLRIGVATGGGGAGITRIYSTNHLILGVDNDPIMMIESGGETGFGTTNPSQRVEVNGKLKIGDDAKAPTAGTIRYNSTKKSFEGYDGSKWINLGGSSPYGVQGTYNLPNSTFQLDISGDEITDLKAIEDYIAIRSTEVVLAGYTGGIPPQPIYFTKVYLQLFGLNWASNWVESLNVDSETLGSDEDFALDFELGFDRLLLGDPKNKKVYEYEPSTFSWILGHTFSSPETVVTDLFGWSVDIYGDETIIGAPERDITIWPFGITYGPGNAYIYDSSNNLKATLSGPGPEDGDAFGFSVGISNNRAIVGSPYNDYGSVEKAGTVTVYNKFNGNWSPNNTFTNQTVEANELYGIEVHVEDSDHLFMRGEIEGIDAYLVENGFWVLKETIASQGSNSDIANSRHKGYDKMVFMNSSSAEDEFDFLITLERDLNNYFIPSASLLNGESIIKGYDITNLGIYTIGSDGKLNVFDY